MTIYLDHAATSPPRPAVLEALDEVLAQPWGNPSSLHRPGRAARMALEEARETCATLLAARVEDIVFTSGATESNNLAVLGTMALAPAGSSFVYSAVEHPSVRECAAALGPMGYRSQTIPVDGAGRIDLDWLQERLSRGDVGLVSVMAVNNEVGTVQPVDSVLELSRGFGVPCHVDAVQAVPGGVPIPRESDLVSLSGHKFGGVPGAGLLKVGHGRALSPRVWGGAQEDSRRPGTQNVPAIVALARGLALALAEDTERVRELRRRLERRLEGGPGVLLAAAAARAAHISAWTFEGLSAESVLVALDLQGVAASSGSACSSHSIEPSRVLMSMGFAEGPARGLIRLSLGWSTTAPEVDRATELLCGVVEELRSRQTLRAAREREIA
ncbi:MAG: cysteine desulfurase [Armatimonadetes bacterium]|nr:cysteine desulfurase [Armatimonadota bacterium]